MGTPLQDFLNTIATGESSSSLSDLRQDILDFFKAEPTHSTLLFTQRGCLLYNGFGKYNGGVYSGSDLEWLVDHGYLIIDDNNMVRAEFDIDELIAKARNGS